MMMKQYLQVTKPGIIFGNLISVIGDSCWPRRGAWMCPCSSRPWWGVTGGGLRLRVQQLHRPGHRLHHGAHQEPRPGAGLIAPGVSLWYATALGVAGIALLYFAANPLAALLAVLGFLVYVGSTAST